MPIDPKVEEPTRQMLAHAIKHELEELSGVIQAAGEKTFPAAIDLCTFAAGYIVVDVCGRWPLEVDLREIARRAVQSVTRLDISEDEFFAFLSRVALGPELLDRVFPAERAGIIPVYAAANLLLKFGPQEMSWFEYLDQIWDAAEATERIKPTVLPALAVRVWAPAKHTAPSREPSRHADRPES
jgi:hypothetical protein